jgi:hypothetical protein
MMADAVAGNIHFRPITLLSGFRPSSIGKNTNLGKIGQASRRTNLPTFRKPSGASPGLTSELPSHQRLGRTSKTYEPSQNRADLLQRAFSTCGTCKLQAASKLLPSVTEMEHGIWPRRCCNASSKKIHCGARPKHINQQPWPAILTIISISTAIFTQQHSPPPTTHPSNRQHGRHHQVPPFRYQRLRLRPPPPGSNHPVRLELHQRRRHCAPQQRELLQRRPLRRSSNPAACPGSPGGD